MKRLLLPLLAAIALPTTVNATNYVECEAIQNVVNRSAEMLIKDWVNAEVANYYLVANLRRSSFVIPMQTLELCEEAGKKYKTSKAWNPTLKDPYQLSYICLKAK